jgi:DNA-binding FadR family transcriptional regulator
VNPVLTYIEQNALKDGDRLPPERDLAAELNISRRSLRQYLTQMELEGQVWRGRRNGTILGRPPATAAVGIDRSFSIASPGDTMESRFAVEPAIAALAATKATEADLSAIETCMRRTAEVLNDDSWVQWDGAFHLAIAEATHNEIFVALVRAFNTARSRPAWREMRIASVTPDKRRNSVAHHRAILNALRQRSPDEASRAMRLHLASVQSNLFD